MKLALFLFVVIVAIFLYSAIVVSSKLSKMEEKQDNLEDNEYNVL